MAEAYTGTSASKITDEFFSYSKRGEMTDVYESTPNSGTPYYHVTAGFWANGAVNTLSSNISGIPAETYGVDSKGRASSVTASSGSNANVVSGTVYDLATFKTTLTLGSGDSDVFTSDPNTGRLTQYKFNVGTKADTGTMTWNANGSLATLAISDTIATTLDTQTCNFAHDDMARIASANCGNSIWRQNFSYDAFGNISKDSAGYTGLTFMPGYSSTTNQFTSLGTYDTDGRLTYDGVNHYTWDADSRVHTVDTSPNATTETYDAMGRMVEKAVGTVHTQIVYSPLGGKYAVMSGQTLTQGFVPLPTGANAVYTTGGLIYYRHHDHLGSSRLATTPARTLYSATAYAPFGEPYAESGTTDRSFTGKDEDTLSGMDDFPARRYRPNQSRWLSPDPAGLAAVAFDRPQTWNRYAYVENNPLSYIDPDGTSDDYDWQAALNALGSSHGGSGSLADAFVASLAGGIFAGVYGWGGTSCTIDGTPSSCDMTNGFLQSGVGVQCPNNQCSGYTADGTYAQFYAFAGGTQGYYNPADLSQGINEANGHLFTNDQYSGYIQSTYGSQIDAQRRALAQAIAANSGISYEQAYASLDPTNGHLQGGNYNFDANGLGPDSLDCGGDARCNGIHFPGQDANGNWFVHLDTSNPFASPFGFLEHGFVDLFLGNVAYNVMPRPWPK